MRTERNLELDLLRALAIAMVITHHLGRTVLKGYLPAFLGEGWTGVDLFFLISGYLVTSSFSSWLDKAGTHAPFKVRAKLAFKYCARRLVRILPPAWIWALIPVLLAVFFNSGGGFGQAWEVFREFLAVIRFQYNYFAVSTGLGQISYFWSLAIEEHFYLFLPFFLLLVRKPVNRIIGLGAIVVLTSLVRIISWKSGVGFGAISFLTHFRSDAISTGCILGLLGPHLNEWLRGRLRSSILRIFVLLAIAFLWIAPAMLNRNTIVVFGYSAFALASAFLIFSALSGMPSFPCPKRISPFIAAIGKRSYTLYLVHLPILIALREIRFRLFGIAPSQACEGWAQLFTELSLFLVILWGITELNFRFLESPLIEIAKNQFGRLSAQWVQSRNNPHHS